MKKFTFVKTLILIVFGIGTTEAMGIGIYYMSECMYLKDNARKTELLTHKPIFRVWYSSPPILKPPVRTAQDAAVEASEMVIGVNVEGKPRAYLVNAMLQPTSHIVSDVIKGRPISVTYCNLSRCVRVFSDEETKEPLDISQAGLSDSQMLIKVAGQTYIQKSLKPFEESSGPASPSRSPGVSPAAFPYDEYPYTLTTWAKWQGEHPDTEIFVGNLGSEPTPSL